VKKGLPWDYHFLLLLFALFEANSLLDKVMVHCIYKKIIMRTNSRIAIVMTTNNLKLIIEN